MLLSLMADNGDTVAARVWFGTGFGRLADLDSWIADESWNVGLDARSRTGLPPLALLPCSTADNGVRSMFDTLAFALNSVSLDLSCSNACMSVGVPSYGCMVPAGLQKRGLLSCFFGGDMAVGVLKPDMVRQTTISMEGTSQRADSLNEVDLVLLSRSLIVEEMHNRVVNCSSYSWRSRGVGRANKVRKISKYVCNQKEKESATS